MMTNTKQKGTNGSAKSSSAKSQQSENSHPTTWNEKDMGKETLGSDYWDRVADDVASGYETDEDTNDILNTDQEADDHLKGDDAP